MKDDKIAKPILQWMYSSNDGKSLHNTVGSVKGNDPFPKPVSGDYIFTKTPTLSGN
jgi:hypothetical protein